MNYCSNCAHPLTRAVPPGDDRVRYVCEACGAVHYENPKVVVGAIPESRGRILLVKRAIEPGYGLWTLPAGYLEKGETALEGAKREAWEEAGARLKNMKPYALFNLAWISQLYIMFRCEMAAPDFAPGHESLEARMFAMEQIPWEKLAFRVVESILLRFQEDRKKGEF